MKKTIYKNIISGVLQNLAKSSGTLSVPPREDAQFVADKERLGFASKHLNKKKNIHLNQLRVLDEYKAKNV